MDRTAVKLLVLDDDPAMLKLLRHMLAQLGFTHVASCGSAALALECFSDAVTQPDLVLFDLNMPEMDGLEFVRELVGRRYAGSLILVSGEDDRILQTAQALVSAHGIHVLGRLRKVVMLDALAALLDAWELPLPAAGARRDRLYLPEELREAIELGQLVNFYQPKVAVATGDVIGVEALVRWQHPGDGLVFPDSFIGIAEDHGLIDALTAVVLSTTVAQARLWRDMQLTLRVAVNVSMDNLASLAFPHIAAAQVAAAGIRPEDVVLEVTESRLSRDLRIPLEVLTRLRLMRFGLAIDDFGTGHSSLAQLRNFPFTELKVDRGFVHGAGGDDTLRAIYNASRQLANQLGLAFVAEGVEDATDWDLLRRTGCDSAQGYFIAKPMPAAEIPAWVAHWKLRVRDEVLITQ